MLELVLARWKLQALQKGLKLLRLWKSKIHVVYSFPSYICIKVFNMYWKLIYLSIKIEKCSLSIFPNYPAKKTNQYKLLKSMYIYAWLHLPVSNGLFPHIFTKYQRNLSEVNNAKNGKETSHKEHVNKMYFWCNLRNVTMNSYRVSRHSGLRICYLK